jgi:hypothetical protein
MTPLPAIILIFRYRIYSRISREILDWTKFDQYFYNSTYTLVFLSFKIMNFGPFFANSFSIQLIRGSTYTRVYTIGCIFGSTQAKFDLDLLYTLEEYSREKGISLENASGNLFFFYFYGNNVNKRNMDCLGCTRTNLFTKANLE